MKPEAEVADPDTPKLTTILKDGGGSKQNGLVSTATSTPPQPPSNGGSPAADKGPVVTEQPTNEESCPRERAQTLSELKKQRAAAKLLSHPLFNGHLGNGSLDSFADCKLSCSEDPRMPLVSSNGSAVYYTPASGDPPILRFKQPMEEEHPKTRTCCCVS